MELYKEEASRIKAILKKNPRGLSVTDISKKIGVNRNTVAKYLELLRISGHVEMENVGTAKVYFLSQRIPVSTLLDFSSDYILVIDTDLKVVQVNNKFSDIAKTTKEDLIGSQIADILPPMISNKTLMEKIDEGLTGKSFVEMLDIIINNELWFLKTKIIPSRFDDGQPGVTLIMENITEEIRKQNSLREEQEKLERLVSERTSELEKANEMLKKKIMERKQIEEKLHEEHGKAQKYLDIAGVLITVTDKHNNIKIINRKGLEILGCTNEEAVGKNLVDAFIFESDKKDAKNLCAQILNEEGEANFESYIVTPSGKKKLITWTNVSFKDKDGNVVGIVASGQDITEQRKIERELKESEKKYRLLADNTFDSIWQLDKDLVFTYANPASVNITDLEADDFIGTNIQDYFPDSEIEKMMKIMSYRLKNGSDDEYTKIETVIYDKSKNLVPIEIYAKMLFDEEGTFSGFQGTTKRVNSNKA